MRAKGSPYAGFCSGLSGACTSPGMHRALPPAEWNPENDPIIAPYNFSKSDPVDSIIKQKRLIRKLLKNWEKGGLKLFAGIKDTTLLMAFIGRITDQKAAILIPILEKLCGWDNIQIAILGSAHPQDPKGRQYADEIRNLSETNINNLFFIQAF